MNAVTTVDTSGKTQAANDSWISQVKQQLLRGDTDFYQVKQVYFWRDLAISTVVSFGAASAFFYAPAFSLPQIGAFALAIFWLSRGTSLMHEISHLKQSELTAFKVAYNVIFGVVTLTPSTFYTWLHRDHHTQKKYGTQQDPEYLPNITSTGHVKFAAQYALKVAVMPVCVFFRFLLAPLSFAHPKLRNLVLTRCSSLTVHWGYFRELKNFNARPFVAIEMLCFVRAAAIPVALFLGGVPWERVPQLYLLAIGGIAINQLRHLADHHYDSDGEKTTLEQEVLDSANHTGGKSIMSWLLYPFAVKYHALHHLAPALPYHNLAAAHNHLVATLPADSPYHSLEVEGWSSIAWKSMFTARKQRTAEAAPAAAKAPAHDDRPVILPFPTAAQRQAQAAPAATTSQAHRRAA